MRKLVDAREEYEEEHPIFQLELEWLDQPPVPIAVVVCASLHRILDAHDGWGKASPRQAKLIEQAGKELRDDVFPSRSMLKTIEVAVGQVTHDDDATSLLAVVQGDIVAGVGCVAQGIVDSDVEMAIEGFSGTNVTLRFLWESAKSDGYRRAINREYARRVEDRKAVLQGWARDRRATTAAILDAAARSASIFGPDKTSADDPWNAPRSG